MHSILLQTNYTALSVALTFPPPAAPASPASRAVVSSWSDAWTTSPTVTLCSGGIGVPSGTVTTRPDLVRLCRRAWRADRPAAHGSPRRAASPVKVKNPNVIPETTAAAIPNQKERPGVSSEAVRTYPAWHRARSAHRLYSHAESVPHWRFGGGSGSTWLQRLASIAACVHGLAKSACLLSAEHRRQLTSMEEDEE